MTDDAPSPTLDLPAAPGRDGAAAAYRVLARKYRPSTFAELIGQDALVRTLTNAIRSGRLAHAFILTGVRGVGKTTTARIVARALNCVGPDGRGGPTPEPCGVCEPCRAIAGDRHMDVMEMDAASRTGVDDIRELIDGVRYGPVSARFKIYIIDEVHMLSRNAFNALLKTLEEPPPHVKFLFATTEIRKVPVTVLSRCQRFDLRRVEAELLARHFAAVAEKEGVTAEPEAIALIARAADGSVRDGLSLLDQAIAQVALAGGGGGVTAAQVRDMLGLADRSVVIDLFEAAVRGEAARALDLLDELHRAGADPLVVLQDLLDFTHFLTRARLLPAAALAPGVPEAERVRGAALAAALSMPVLTRTWQMLLKGIGEVQQAPAPQAALEMVLIRLIHAAGLPTPGDILRRLESGEYGDASAASAAPASAPAFAGREPVGTVSGTAAANQSGRGAPTPAAFAAPAPPSAAALAPRAAPAPLRGDSVPAAQGGTASGGTGAAAPAHIPAPPDFRTLVAIFQERADPLLHSHLYTGVHPVRYEPGRIELRLRDGVPQTLPSRLAGLLQEWTGGRWMVSVSNAPGEPTLSEQDRAAELRAKEEAAAHPLVRAVLAAFPGASIAAVHDLTQPGEAEEDGGAAALPAPPDEAGDE